MAQVVYSARSLEHIAGAFKLIRETAPATARGAAAAIGSAVASLGTHPLIGRRVEGELRELVISSGQSGFVALYRFAVLQDEVQVLAIRRQRDLGFMP